MTVSVKEHYRDHLSHFYSWMLGDFEEKQKEQELLFQKHSILPHGSKLAIDLGAGNGLQAMSLAKLGFDVIAVDSDGKLLGELEQRRKQLAIQTIMGDIRSVAHLQEHSPELIVCCGDTLTHLESASEIEQLLRDSYAVLEDDGIIFLTFRDYSTELVDSARFIPVRSDQDRILTCFLEYFPDKVRVADILYERLQQGWVQKISSYFKVRVSAGQVKQYLESAGFELVAVDAFNRIVMIIGKKKKPPAV